MADLIDRIELMRQIAEFGREIPKDQVMEVIARMEDVKVEGDLISRQAATSIPIPPKEHRKVFKGEDDAFETGWNEALACVNMLPSADRPKGEWVYHEDYKLDGECCYECSNCGRMYDYKMNYCGYCGSDNRERSE